jgi:hypothetical protein
MPGLEAKPLGSGTSIGTEICLPVNLCGHNERLGGIDLDHGESPAGGRNGVAFSCASLLANPQCIQLRLDGAPIDYFGR